jgi:protein-disulfide isomerase
LKVAIHARFYSARRKGFPVRCALRQVIVASIIGTAALALGTAFALQFSLADLMEPGPLGEQALGAENAPVTIIYYASMTCGACGDFVVNEFPKLKERYIETGKVRFIFREFPRDVLDMAAFALARCADKDKYFPMIEALFQQRDNWVVKVPMEPLFAIAKQAGLTQQSIEACLTNQKVQEGIEWVGNRADEKLGVHAVPVTFYNGHGELGPPSLEHIETLIQSYLKN